MRRFLPILMLGVLAACQQRDEPAAAPTPEPVASPSAAPTAAAGADDLSRYVGAYPTEATAGAPSFLRLPAVRDAVSSVVGDAGVRETVLGSDVTATPIVMEAGKLLAFGCEPHNCGPHNWTIALRPDGGAPAVCYYDQDRRVARWYPEGAGPAPVNGCPSGD
jgi:hypothetical protein